MEVVNPRTGRKIKISTRMCNVLVPLYPNYSLSISKVLEKSGVITSDQSTVDRNRIRMSYVKLFVQLVDLGYLQVGYIAAQNGHNKKLYSLTVRGRQLVDSLVEHGVVSTPK